MDTLRNLFGNATSTIFRLVLVAGTIILVSVFIVKPTLDTTEKAIDSGNRIFDQTQTGPNSIQQQIQRDIRRTNRRIQRQINRARRQAQGAGGIDAQALQRCILRANGNANKIQACAQAFG